MTTATEPENRGPPPSLRWRWVALALVVLLCAMAIPSPLDCDGSYIVRGWLFQQTEKSMVSSASEEKLIELLGHNQMMLSWAAAYRLRHEFGSAPLMRALKTHDTHLGRTVAADWLAHFQGSEEVLRALEIATEDSHMRVRAAAARSLSEIGDERHLARLEQLAQEDKSDMVRRISAEGVTLLKERLRRQPK